MWHTSESIEAIKISNVKERVKRQSVLWDVNNTFSTELCNVLAIN